MTALIKLLGLLGGSFFTYCGIPVAWATFRAGRSIGTPIVLGWCIPAGVICTYAYIILTYGFDTVITVNDSIEFMSWTTILFYHYFPKNKA
jgi:hypothetical protein